MYNKEIRERVEDELIDVIEDCQDLGEVISKLSKLKEKVDLEYYSHEIEVDNYYESPASIYIFGKRLETDEEAELRTRLEECRGEEMKNEKLKQFNKLKEELGL